jgi:hypothetical protein
MYGLESLIAAGTVAVSVQYDSTEQAAGLVAQGVPQGPATGVSPEMVVRVPLVAGGGGADDVLVYPFGGLPSAKIRILSAYADISTAGAGGSLLEIYSSTGGGGGSGTLCAEISSAATGRATQDNQVKTSVVLTNGTTVGLWVHRTDNTVVGEVFIVLRPEI